MFLKYIFLCLVIPLSLLAKLESVSFDNFFLDNRNVMLLIDPSNGKIVRANKASAKFYYKTIKQLESMNIKDINSFTKSQVQNEMQKAKAEKRNYFIFNHKLGNGKTQKVRVFSSPITYENKKILHSTIYPLILKKEYKDYYNKTLEEQVEIQSKFIKESQNKVTFYLSTAIIFLVLIVFILYYFFFTKSRLSKKLEAEKTKYKTMMTYSSDAIVIVDMNAKVLQYSNELKNMLGYDDEELKILHVYDFEYIYTKEQIFEIIKELDSSPISFESQFKRKNDDIIDVSINIVKIKINNVDCIYSSIRDITKQKALQRYIKNQKEEFETIFKSVREGIAILDLNSEIINCNDAFINLSGYSKDELLLKKLNELTFEKNDKAVSYAIEHEYVENIENDFIQKNGTLLNVNISITLLSDKKRLLLTIKDMTTVKMLEQNERLASMGEMIGNIAHQWRQPLSVITANASGMKLMLDVKGNMDEEFVNNSVSSIMGQADYLSKTIDNFRDFVKGEVSYMQISIKETLEQTLSLIDASLKMSYITVVTDIKDDIIIDGSIQELEQAFLNILNNSKDILNEKVDDVEDRVIIVSTTKVSNNSLELIIKDSGGGIEPDILDKIFEPYFTTKHQSQGTGLGLSMVDKIIRERHKGTILVNNETFIYNNKELKGTSFKITFTNN